MQKSNWKVFMSNTIQNSVHHQQGLKSNAFNNMEPLQWFKDWRDAICLPAVSQDSGSNILD